MQDEIANVIAKRLVSGIFSATAFRIVWIIGWLALFIFNVVAERHQVALSGDLPVASGDSNWALALWCPLIISYLAEGCGLLRKLIRTNAALPPAADAFSRAPTPPAVPPPEGYRIHTVRMEGNRRVLEPPALIRDTTLVYSDGRWIPIKEYGPGSVQIGSVLATKLPSPV